MAFEAYTRHKKAFVFELDNVIYPEKDYMLQVYYLFAQFMEYGEQMDAGSMLQVMQDTYYKQGAGQVFDQAAAVFSVPEKYRLNFNMLLTAAKLPLKLLIFSEVLKFMQEIVIERKQIFLFTDGAPAIQLNKIRQTEWHGLESYLEVHFSAESKPKPSPEGLLGIQEKHQLKKADLLMIGKTATDRICAENAGIDFLNADKLLLP